MTMTSGIEVDADKMEMVSSLCSTSRPKGRPPGSDYDFVGPWAIILRGPMSQR